MAENEQVEVEDKATDTNSLEETKAFEEAFRLSPNKAGNKEVSDRAQRQVMSCLAQAERGWADRYSKFAKLQALWHHESLSPAAQDMNVHMGLAYQKNEEYTGKMTAAIYGNQGSVVGGEVELEDDNEKKELAVALVQERLVNEAKFRRDAQKHFREAGIYGTRIGKLVPVQTVKSVITRKPRMTYNDFGDPVYIFPKAKEEEIVDTELKCYPVSVFDFRIPDTADSIEEADWCGEYSYPSQEELESLVELGKYDRTAFDEATKFIQNGGDMGSAAQATGAPRVANRVSQGISSQFRGASPNQAPGATELTRFEWWGNFDIDGNGHRRPCVITILLPAHEQRPHLSGPSHGWVVRIERNPYYHQRKPYLYHPVIKKEGEFYGPGIMELVGSHSFYEDEFATLALRAAYLEGSPPLEVSELAGIDDSELEGFLPGKTLHTERSGEINWLGMPKSSPHMLQVLDYFGNKSVDVAGLGTPSNQPRNAAAGIIAEAQEIDLRLMAFVDSYEQYWLSNAAELTHAYNQQFMTREKKVKTLGVKGIRSTELHTVKPTDLAVDIRFEPLVGKKLVQKTFQGQMLINWWDRAMASNAAAMQMPGMVQFDLGEMAEFIFRETFGVGDPQKFVKKQVDPMKLRTVAEEHRLFAMGERPGVQEGEKAYHHAASHIDFYMNGGADDWNDEDREALAEHIYDTIDEVRRQTEAAMPGQGEIMAQMLQAELGEVAQPAAHQSRQPERTPQGPGGQNPMGGGGVGPGNPANAANGSPLMRRPNVPGVQSNSMGASPNLGAQ